jgi:hypothetical protein
VAWVQKHRNAWLARWQEFDYDKRQRVTRSKRFPTEGEAQAHADKMLAVEAVSNPRTWSQDAREIAGIELPEALETRFRVDRYLTKMVDTLDIRETSRASYRTSVRLHFKGPFGRADIRTVTGAGHHGVVGQARHPARCEAPRPPAVEASGEASHRDRRPTGRPPDPPS